MKHIPNNAAIRESARAETASTPAPGTMVVHGDLYYLSGELLPEDASAATIIFAETPITVYITISCGPQRFLVGGTFCFSPWVFDFENRWRLPGHIFYSGLTRKAERELADAFERTPGYTIKQRIEKFSQSGVAPKKGEHYPYVWIEATAKILDLVQK